MKNMMLDYSKSEYCSLTAHGYWALQEAAGKAASTGIDCPLLVMCGTKDQAGSTKRYDREWERCEGAPLVWIEGAGYNSNTDAPDEVNRLIEEFVSGL